MTLEQLQLKNWHEILPSNENDVVFVNLAHYIS
jgi:hypothetical protein